MIFGKGKIKGKIKGLQITGFMLFAIFGVILAAQFKSTYQNTKESEKLSANTGIYAAQLKDEVAKGEQYKNELAQLERDKQQLIASNAFTSSEYLLRIELEKVKLKAGLTDVKGQGLIVTMNDLNVNSDQIIHDLHVVEVVNEMKVSGAEAIAVNGQRIMPFSEQVCAGLKIRINKFRYSVPFVISAIGDPDKLYDAVINSPVIISLRAKKIAITIDKVKDLTVPKYFGDLTKAISGLEEAE